MADPFQRVFADLMAHLVRNSSGLAVLHDAPGKYYLVSSKRNRGGNPIWFGGVEIMKNYVSYHLFAIACDPTLTAHLSPDLRKRMQGKACFNFKAADEDLFAELGAVTDRCRAAFETMRFDR